VVTELVSDKESPQLAGTAVTWTASASDADGDPLEFQFNLDGQAIQDWSESPVWVWNASDIGQHEISVKVRDNQHNAEGDSAKSASFEIIAPQNNAPVATELVADKESPQLLGTAVTWTASASDADGDPIFYRFLVNGSAATEWQPESEWNWTASEPGTSTITVQVRDDKHDEPADERASRSMDFIILAIVPEIKPEEGPVAFENVSETLDNGTLMEENGIEQELPAQNGTVPPPAENITEPIVAEPVAPVNETYGTLVNETDESTSVPAAENQTPVINSLSADVKSPQTPGTTITWIADATDADSDPLSFRFLLNGPTTGGIWQTVSDWSDYNSWVQKTSSADIGESQVKVQIRDGKHALADGYDFEAVAFFTISEPTMNISGAAFDDKNENGIFDGGEGLSGWTIRLTKPDGSEVSALTREDGSYRFEQLKAGTYAVSEELPAGWTAVNGQTLNVELLDADVVDRNFANKLSAFSISGMKYNDLDGNGANDGEPGIGGWTIQLSRDGNAVNSTATGKDGSYRFEALSPGTYTITEVEQSGWVRTAPTEGSYSVTLKDADVSGMDFGNHGSWAISGTSFFDRNGNGIRDSDESGLAGWSIQLSKDGAVINATTTDKDGAYSFTNLAPGKYTLSEVSQDGWSVSIPAEGSYSVDLSNADVSGKDFGNKGSFTISGVKFYDANENQVQDSDEPAIPGQAVTLSQNGIEIANITSSEDGSYTFDNLAPGTYEVDDPIVVSVSTKSVVVAPIPVAGKSSISGVKFNDLNGNGIKDAGEPGIANWQMVLAYLGPVDRPVPEIILSKARTDSKGAYLFKNLFPGVYEVSELSQKGWVLTTTETIRVTVPGSKSSVDFGNRLESQPGKASVWGVKYNDLNGNGVNNGEPGLSGWTIKLKNLATSSELTTTTNAEGWYSFTNLEPGSYQISEVMQNGWAATSPVGGASAPFALAAGENKQVDFGNRNNNQPPVVISLTAIPASPQRVGQSISLTAKATDPEGDPLQYRFIIRDPASGQVQSDTGYASKSVWSWNTIGYMAGNYQAEVWIRDGKHSDASGSDAIKSMAYKLTAANLPPQINVLYSDRPDPQYSGSWVKWTAIASDPEGDPLQYKFYLRGPKTNGFWMDQTGWSKNNRWIWRTSSFDVGYSQILVAVRDGSHSGPSGADDYDIAEYAIININLPPTITGLASNLNSPQPIGATVWWQASASDPEGDLVFYRYWIKGPGTGDAWALAQDWSTDPTWVWPTSIADAGTSQIQVQVSDGLHSNALGWDDDAGALFTLLAPNQPPTLISLKADKASPQNAGKTIKWTAVASDPDREPIYYRFWLKGPSTGNSWQVVQDWSVKNQWTWTSSGYDSGSYSVYVYARDGSHNPDTSYDSAMGALYQLTANPLPKLTALKSDKKSPQTAGTTVKWTATANDANKDPIQYRFWLKGPSTNGAWAIVQDWSAKNQWTWTSSGYDSGSYSIYVYARDGSHNPATSYDSAMGALYQLTANNPPSLISLTSDKKSPQASGTTIKWTATASDADKDPLLYQFWLKGPSTGNAWKDVQGWSSKNQWTWKSAPTDWGSYRIFVYVRDGKHALENAYDSALGQDYQLTNNVVVVTNKVAVIGTKKITK
jgi:protocatechuate 3,4-dioxygenase beta subunit